jgi:hypothetical protein
VGLTRLLNKRKSQTFLGVEVLTAVVLKSTVVWDVTQCSLLKINSGFEGTYRLHLQGRRISGARNRRENRCPLLATYFHARAYSSTLKMEAIYTPETSIDFQRATRRYIPKDTTLQI